MIACRVERDDFLLAAVDRASAAASVGWASANEVWFQLEGSTVAEVRDRLQRAYELGHLSRADSRNGWLWRRRTAGGVG